MISGTDIWTKKADGPTGFLGSIMEGDATRGYVGLGIWDAIGSDNGDISVYNPATDVWSSLPGLTSRHNSYSFIANDHLYIGGGYTRYSQQDGISHYDFYKLPLSGINFIEETSINNLNVFPNPSNGLFKIENSNGKMISMFDVNGKKVFMKRMDNDIIDLRIRLSPGIYIIQCEGKEVKKILIN